eukprot:m51a1_g11379 hypothetical protein (430) ;mRNA; r:18-1307
MAARKPATERTFVLRKLDVEGTQTHLCVFQPSPVALQELPPPLHVSHDDAPRAAAAEAERLRSLRASNPTEYAERTRPLSQRVQAIVAEQRRQRLHVWGADESAGVWDGAMRATSSCAGYALVWHRPGGPADELCVSSISRWFTLRPRPMSLPPTAEEAEVAMSEIRKKKAPAAELLRGVRGDKLRTAEDEEDEKQAKAIDRALALGGRRRGAAGKGADPEDREDEEDDDPDSAIDAMYKELKYEELREEEEAEAAEDQAAAAKADEERRKRREQRRRRRAPDEGAPDYDAEQEFDDDKEGLEDEGSGSESDEEAEDDDASASTGGRKRQAGDAGAQPDAKRAKTEQAAPAAAAAAAPAPPKPQRPLRLCEEDVVEKLREYGEVEARRFIQDFTGLITKAEHKKQFADILRRVSKTEERAGNRYISLKK